MCAAPRLVSTPAGENTSARAGQYPGIGRSRQKYNAWLQAKTVKNRATYVGQVDNLPPIANRLIAGGPIANRPAGYPSCHKNIAPGCSPER